MSAPSTIQVILEKYLRGELDAADQSRLNDWLNESAANRALFERLNDEAHVKGLLEKMDEVNEHRIRDKISNWSGHSTAAPVRPVNFWKRSMGWAAILVMVMLAAGGYLFFSNKTHPDPSQNKHTVQEHTILPGKDGAVLTLSDGSTMVLDSLGHGVVTTQGSTKVVLKDGKLLYENNASSNMESPSPLANTMTTPKGRQYQLILPDGSKVWLNAASSITFPTAFTGKERKVMITGEVYFEVAPLRLPSGIKVPFLVTTNTMTVEVLGTHFNINAYNNEESMKTTLLEGSVRVVNGESSNVQLEPGQQAQILLSSQSLPSPQIQVQTAILEEVMAWKNGVFSFREADIQTVMRQLERWYDIEVKYAGVIPKDRFSGKVSRSANLAQVLKILEFSDVSFRIEGKTLIVIPPAK